MRKRSEFRPSRQAGDFSRYMPGLHADQKSLTEIQGAYDNLALLGQLLSAGTDISAMRLAFNELADQLLDQLALEHYNKAVRHLDACARVSIDVLTRNLFERTADIGFLATDSEICAFAEQAILAPAQAATGRGELEASFAEYVRKYSVYHDIILLAPNGEILARLDGQQAALRTQDPLLAEALVSPAPYLEIFRPTDLLPGDPTPLIYAHRVESTAGEPVGVLCLCFRFQDECQRIFANLLAEDDWTVLTLLDADNRVIASSDPYQLPIGARLESVHDDNGRVIRFAGREYLATTRATQGYQGYAGAGWVGHALAPLTHAFEESSDGELAEVPEDFLHCVLETTHLFSPVLREMPARAANIQHELNRAVWNGNVWLARDPAASHSAAFAKVLLREIGSTGVRTRNIFAESTTNLYKTVLSSVLCDCATQAALAIDIMDRNLYERANDCRWWALNSDFHEALAEVLVNSPGNDKVQRQRLTDALRRINGLYTVYSNLILFDQSGRVVAVSNPAYNDLPGKILNAAWVRPTLGLADSQSYCVSEFADTPLYDNQQTYIFSAAIRSPHDDEPLGGIAIVFDSTPQFRAMLEDALPRQADGKPVAGAFAVFAERNGRVVASTNPELKPGMPLMIGYEFFHLEPGASCSNVIIHDGCYYAVGSAMSAGYREYSQTTDGRRNDVVALVFSPLSERIVDADSLQSLRDVAVDHFATRQNKPESAIDIASFYLTGHWYGIHSSQVVEAVDATRITPMPSMGSCIVGCLMYDDQALSVFDLSAILCPQRAAIERRRSPQGNARQQIVIVNAATQQTRFGMLVDQLGAVCDIATQRAEALPEMMNEGNSMIDSLIKPLPDDAERRILMVLSPDRIVQRLGGSQEPPRWLTSGTASPARER
jgi:chemotaxis signal transduction protein